MVSLGSEALQLGCAYHSDAGDPVAWVPSVLHGWRQAVDLEVMVHSHPHHRFHATLCFPHAPSASLEVRAVSQQARVQMRLLVAS